MNASDGDLLRRFVQGQSESAFEELVRRHVGLVYSAALRQVNNDRHLAQDVTQIVFSDLARKAPKLARHSSLAGWLYTSTRYAASMARRSENRRARREQEAHAMQKLDVNLPESDWAQISPLLDEAMHSLSDEDREAVLLRHFEQQSFAEIAAHFGLNENTARMRVDRALGKLQSALARRGITSTALALGVALNLNAAPSVPAALASGIVRNALTAAGGGLFLTASSFLGSWLVKTAALAVVAAVILTTWMFTHNRQRQTSTEVAFEEDNASLAIPDNERVVEARNNGTTEQAGEIKTSPALDEPDTNALILTVLDSSSGEPIPETVVEANKLKQVTDAMGRVRLRKPEFTTGDFYYRITISRDGYVPRYVSWSKFQKDNVQDIPAEYTAHLGRADTIGGTVVDETGVGIPHVKIIFTGPSPVGVSDRERPTIMGDYHSEMTDETGRWGCTHVPHELADISYRLVHSNYITTEVACDTASSQQVDRQSVGETELKNSTAVFVLKRGLEVSGFVHGPGGYPISGARVTDKTDWRECMGTAETDGVGRFRFANAKPGELRLSVQAEGMAPENRTIVVQSPMDPVIFNLNGGNVVRGRVIDEAGEPIAGANIEVDRVDFQPAAFKWTGTTDADGRFIWTSAPSEPLPYFVDARGYFWKKVPSINPDGEEKIIQLEKWKDRSRFAVSGLVYDSETRHPITNFLVEVWEYSSGSYSPFRREFSNRNGEYRIPLEAETTRFRIEVRAEGYYDKAMTNQAPVTQDHTFDFGLNHGS